MATVTVRMVATGGRRILQALSGLRRANQQSNRSAQRESTRTKRTVEKNIRATEAIERGAGDTTERTEKKKQRAVRKTERERERSFRAQVSRERRLIRQQRHDARARALAERQMGRGGGVLRGIGRGATALGAGALGGARAGLGVIQGLQGTLGIRSQQEIIGGLVPARQGFIRALTQGGVTGAVQPHLNRVAGISRRTGVAPEEILGAIGASQTRFNTIGRATQAGPGGLDRMFEQFESFARVSRATGSSLGEVQAAALEFERQLDLSGDDVVAGLNLVVDGAARGSLSLGDFANAFPQAIGAFRAARGVSGIEALAEFSALGQQLAGTGLRPEVARTAQQQIISQLANRNVQRKLGRAGVDALDDEGLVRNIGDIIAEIAASPRLQTQTQLGGVFNEETSRAIASLVVAERGGTTLNERITAATPEAGAELVTATLAALNADVSGDVIRQRIEREARLVEQSDELIAAFAGLTRGLTELEDEHPLLSTVGLPVATGAAQGLGAAALLSRLGGGGAAAAVGAAPSAGLGLGAAGAGAGGLAGLAGTGVGAASLGAIAAAVAAGLAVAGVAVAGISATGLFATGDEAAGGRSLLTQLGDLPDDIAIAFSGGILESLENAISGPASADAAIAEQRRLSARKEIVGLDAATIRALKPIPFEPGAGRRREGGSTE